MNSNLSQLRELSNDLNTVGGFLSRRDVETHPATATFHEFDVIVLLGSSVLETVNIAAERYKAGWAKHLLISGGVGHSTHLLWDKVRACPDLQSIKVEDRSEAFILRDVLHVRHSISLEAILVEDQSTNCGANAWETRRTLEIAGIDAKSILLIQDPTMQRRSHASFQRAWRGKEIRFLSFAPFVPRVSVDSENLCLVIEPAAWTIERFIDLVLGEIPRLNDAPGGYGPAGRDFIEHVEIPGSVLAAHARLTSVLGDSTMFIVKRLSNEL